MLAPDSIDSMDLSKLIQDLAYAFCSNKFGKKQFTILKENKHILIKVIE